MGDVFSSPGCSVMNMSAGDPGGWALGGVDEAFRARVDAPLPFTQDVSITLTPILPQTERKHNQSSTPLKNQSKKDCTMLQAYKHPQSANVNHWKY